MCATSYERDARKQIYDSQRERDWGETPWENATKIKLVQKVKTDGNGNNNKPIPGTMIP